MSRVTSTISAPPPVSYQGREWSSAELTSLALGWRRTLRNAHGDEPSPIAMIMANHPEAIALFFALSSLPSPVILLPDDLRPWHDSPPVPAGTRLALAPAQRAFGATAERLGMMVMALPERPDAGGETADFMTAPAVVLFTSGSTDLPKPVCRPSQHLVAAATSIARAGEFPEQGGIIGTLPLARIFGLHHCLLSASILGRPLTLLPRFHHRAVLDLFATRRDHYWAGTPFMADFLGRSVPSGTHPAPPRCVISGRVSAPVAETFLARFDVPLRQVYGTTETGPITLDASPIGRVRSQTAGTPLPGAAVAVGDDPEHPSAPGELGKIWVRTPWSMDGYGFPGSVEPAATVNGWWLTPDVGHVDGHGCLTVAGRADACIRTASGHLVNPDEVAAAIEGYHGVRDAAVVPLGDTTDLTIGVLVEGDSALSLDELRRHLAATLPPWSLPRVIERTGELPRLTGGKLDRLACIGRLTPLLSRGQRS